MDENQGLKQAVETMKNTIEQMRQRGHCDKYYNLNLNSSIENNKSLQYELECEGYLNRNTSIINKTIPSTQYNQQTQHQDFDLNETTSDDFFINSRKYGDAAHQHEEDTPRYDAAEEQDGHAAAQEQNGQAVAQEQDGHVAAHEHDGHVAAHEQDGHVATHEQDGHVMAHEWDGHVVAHERDRHVTAYEQEAYVTDSCSTLSNTLAQLQEQLDNIQKQLKGLQKSITPQEIKTASAQIPNVTQAYRTVSTEAATVIPRVIPIDLQIEERAASYGKSKEERGAIREQTLTKWQERWEQGQKGAWTRELIRDVIPWYNRRFGEVDFWLTQVLSGHGCFEAFVHKIGKKASPTCRFCDMIDNAEHTLFVCPRWGQQRERTNNLVGRRLTKENLIECMLFSERNWKEVKKLTGEIMREKAEIERMERERELTETVLEGKGT
ncbi:hypothetical protein M8J76_002642 [Diaphorina citri]|nr:hypothetical protein M8J76_002642 [Diaphorina citri]